MKYFFITLFVFIFLESPFSVHAQSLPFISRDVFYTPTRALIGDDIALHAVVKNTQPSAGTMTLHIVASDNKEILHKKDVTLDVHAERVVTLLMTMPQEPQVIDVVLTQFESEEGTVFSLNEQLGQVTLSPSETRDSKLMVWYTQVRLAIEKQRAQWLFAVQSKKETLDASVPQMRDRVGDALTFSDTGNPSEFQPEAIESTVSRTLPSMAWTALERFLESSILFYSVIVLILIGVVRWLIGRFV